jgi:vanadium chloroperoxidase
LPDRDDKLAFEFVSDEFNGRNADATGMVRPSHNRKFNSIEEAIRENGRSRVYLGVHWQFDAEERAKGGAPATSNVGGIKLGLRIANKMWSGGFQTAASVAKTLT